MYLYSCKRINRSIHSFIMNICSALTAYCFFDNKPDALPVHVENSRHLTVWTVILSRTGVMITNSESEKNENKKNKSGKSKEFWFFVFPLCCLFCKAMPWGHYKSLLMRSELEIRVSNWDISHNITLRFTNYVDLYNQSWIVS